jgi:hypothetical protein
VNPARNFWRGLGWAAYAMRDEGKTFQRNQATLLAAQEGAFMRVFIRRNADGAEVEDMPNWKPHYMTRDVYWWTEGNMSCDCNRHLEFERAHGRDLDAGDVECGHGLYSVRLELDDGTVVE